MISIANFKKRFSLQVKVNSERRTFIKKMFILGGVVIFASKPVARSVLHSAEEKQNQFDYSSWPCRM